MIRRIFFFLLFICCFSASAQDTVKAMFYNLLNFPEANPSNRELILRDILSLYEPDIFMVCELQNMAGADLILDSSLNHNGLEYSRAPFVFNQSGGNSIQQLIFFRNDLFSLETSEIITTPVRDINKYVLKLNTVDQDVDPILLHIYVTHLKSSQGSSNQALRLEMVTEFTDHLETIDPNSYVIFAGDYNIYTSTEPAYIELLDSNNAIQMVDPIDTPGSWNNNINFQGVHTQSTRISSGPFGDGAGGGLDDRFDIITVSQNMMDDPKMRYVASTYKSYGNNGNCFNNSINDDACSGDFNMELRTNLYNMSDHLPVVMEFETNQEILLDGTDFDVNLSKFTIENSLVKDILHITVSPELIGKDTFEIYNTLGQRILHKVHISNKNIEVDVSQLSSGVYYIRTKDSNRSSLKFLKAS